jgi:chorismate-pyruvate lyase
MEMAPKSYLTAGRDAEVTSAKKPLGNILFSSNDQ